MASIDPSKYYTTRNGLVVIVTERRPAGKFCVRGFVIKAKGERVHCSWTAQGKHQARGGHEYDLMEVK